MDYLDWVRDYPDYLILKQEWSSTAKLSFYYAYGDYAQIVHNVKNYTLIQTGTTQKCGGSKYQIIGDALKQNGIKYMVVNSNDIIDIWRGNDVAPNASNTQPTSAPSPDVQAQQQATPTVPNFDSFTFTMHGNTDQFMSAVRFFIENGIDVKIESGSLQEDKAFDQKNTASTTKIEDTIEFSNSDRVIDLNSVFYVVNLADGKDMKVKLVSAEYDYRYIGAGGAYYGAITQRTVTPTAGSMLTDGTLLITPECELGRFAMGKKVHDKIMFQKNNKSFKYIVKDVQ